MTAGSADRPPSALGLVLGDDPLPPATVGRGGWAVRSGVETLRSGVVGRLAATVRVRRHRFPDGPPDGLLAAADAAGCAITGDALVVRDGGLLVPVDREGRPALLRLAADGPGLGRHVAALRRFGDADPTIPDLLHDSVHRDLRLVVEVRLPGGPPTRAARPLLVQVAAVLDRCGQLVDPPAEPLVDRDGTDASALPASLAAEVLDALPDLAVADVLRPLADLAAAGLAGVATGLQHGDLWHRNLLVRRGRLEGVLDWDAWRPDGLPAADLLGLQTTSLRLRRRLPIGRAVALRTWQDAADDLRAAGVGDVDLDAVGVVWWLTSLAGTLRRLPARAADRRWIRAAVLSAGDARWA